MDRQQKYEQEVDLKDLLFHILYKWRCIILFSVVTCVLFSGYAFIREIVCIEDMPNSQEQQESVDGVISEEGLEETDEKKEKPGLLQYAAMGFVGGMFAVAFGYGIIYILSDRIRGERELSDRYGYYLLGVIPQLPQKKFLSCIDRFLFSLAGDLKQITEEEAYNIITVNIINLAKEGSNVLVTGTVAENELQKFASRIASQVKKITLTVGTDMNVTAGTLEKLAECDSVILVEKRDRSLREKIFKEQESIAALDKTVTGYVLI